MTFANDSLIALRKTLRVSFISEMLNFFCLFIMFKILFLIICENDSTACSYSKLFMLLRFICDFFKKKLHCSISVFFCVVRAAHHLKQLLNYNVVLKQYRDSTQS